MDINNLWDKTAYYIVHYGTIWVSLALALAALGSWRLTNVLNNHNMRMKEAKLSWYVAVGNGVLAVGVLVASAVMK